MNIRQSDYTITIPIRGDRTLAYNSIGQTFALWDQNDLATWNGIGDGTRGISDPGVADFLTHRFAVSEGMDELAGVRREYENNRASNQTLQVTVCTTLYCNLACGYCFQGQVKPSTKMGPEVRDALEEYVRLTLPNRGFLSLCWYGGEPLMGQDALFDLSDRFEAIRQEKRAGKSGFIVTNGYLLTVDVAQKLVDAGVTIAQVTLDGPAEMHDERRPLLSGRGSYEKIVENIVAVSEATKLAITIRVNSDATNRDAVSRMLHDLADRGLGLKKRVSVYFAPVEATTVDCANCESSSLQKETYAAFEMEMMRLAGDLGLSLAPSGGRFLGLCQAVRPRSIVITPTGDVHKCWETVNQPELRHGTIFDMVAAEQSAIAKRWTSWSPFDNPVCAGCRILPMCAGACAFKTVHTEQQQGESKLPCPSWKFNFAEKMFLRAQQRGIVTAEDWLPGESNTLRGDHRITGDRHTYDSVRLAAERLDAQQMAEPVPAE